MHVEHRRHAGSITAASYLASLSAPPRKTICVSERAVAHEVGEVSTHSLCALATSQSWQPPSAFKTPRRPSNCVGTATSDRILARREVGEVSTNSLCDTGSEGMSRAVSQLGWPRLQKRVSLGGFLTMVFFGLHQVCVPLLHQNLRLTHRTVVPHKGFGGSAPVRVAVISSALVPLPFQNCETSQYAAIADMRTTAVSIDDGPSQNERARCLE
jgi:hypothetical protein